MSDIYWLPLSFDRSGYLPWLRDHGSLTRRIQQRCNAFHVQNIYDGFAKIPHDEAALLGTTNRELVYTREVFLFANDKPVVFAHSAVAPDQLHGTWRALQHLGNRSLGSLLFTHPLVERAPLHFRSLKPGHMLYRRAAAVLDRPPHRLRARRSLFTLHGAPLLVTEVFLPDVLQLRP